MKILLTVLMLICFSAYSQTNNDLDKLKQEIKQINSDKPTVKKASKSDYISEIVGGSFLMGGGSSLLGFGFYNRYTKINSINQDILSGKYNASQMVESLKSARKRYIIGFTCGSVLSASGIILTVFGVKHRQVYINNKNNVSLGMSDNDLGLKITF